MITDIEVCRLCGEPVHEISFMQGVMDDTVYFCDSCGEWIEGLPENREFEIRDVTDLL